MVKVTLERELLGRFSQLLAYPRPGLAETARECERMAGRADRAGAGRGAQDDELGSGLGRFRAFVEETPLPRLEEVYSDTFDLDPTCHPYVGYHLFGENYRRSAFMVELRRRYAAEGFAAPEKELPDHLAVLLEFVARTEDPALGTEIIEEALVPALDRMLGKARSEGYQGGDSEVPGQAKRKRDPYRGLLEALRLALLRISEAEAVNRAASPPPGAGADGAAESR